MDVHDKNGWVGRRTFVFVVSLSVVVGSIVIVVVFIVVVFIVVVCVVAVFVVVDLDVHDECGWVADALSHFDSINFKSIPRNYELASCLKSTFQNKQICSKMLKT